MPYRLIENPPELLPAIFHSIIDASLMVSLISLRRSWLGSERLEVVDWTGPKGHMPAVDRRLLVVVPCEVTNHLEVACNTWSLRHPFLKAVLDVKNISIEIKILRMRVKVPNSKEYVLSATSRASLLVCNSVGPPPLHLVMKDLGVLTPWWLSLGP
jgi:hypothetical protein